MTKISIKEIKKTVRKVNPNRQYGSSWRNQNAYNGLALMSGKLVDLFAQYVEEQMVIPPKSGEGCRVQYDHVERCFGKMREAVEKFMAEERKKVPVWSIKEEEE